MKKQEEANRKKEQEALSKEKKNIEIKDTLQRQIQLLHQKKKEQSLTNPEQNNYSFFNSIFRERKASVDKKEYNSYLQKQAEEQRLNKLQQHYMSEEEYRLNANQLNVNLQIFRKLSVGSTPMIDTLIVQLEPWEISSIFKRLILSSRRTPNL